MNHECEANAQALIFISRRRLCGQASPETREAWKEVKEKITQVDPVLGSVMVPECIYRGFCRNSSPAAMSIRRRIRRLFLHTVRKDEQQALPNMTGYAAFARRCQLLSPCFCDTMGTDQLKEGCL